MCMRTPHGIADMIAINTDSLSVSYLTDISTDNLSISHLMDIPDFVHLSPCPLSYCT